MFYRDIFKRINTIIPPTVMSSSGVTLWTSTTYKQGQNYLLTLEALVGNTWFANTTACSTTTGFKLIEGDCIDISVLENLSFLGESTTSSIQAIIWEK